MTGLGDILVVIGTALGCGSIIVIGFEAARQGALKRPRPFQFRDLEPPSAVLLTESSLTESQLAEIEALWAARHSEYVPTDLFHNGTINR